MNLFAEHPDLAGAMRLAAVAPLILAAALGAGAAEPAGGAALAAAATSAALAAKTCRVSDFGAVGDGVADDSPAFQKALEAIAAAGKGALQIPAGDYRFARPVALKLKSWNVALVGEGQGVSCLHGDNGEGVFRFELATRTSEMTFRDMTFIAHRAGAGAAIAVSAPEGGTRNYRTLTIQNVDMRGVDVTQDCFDYGVKAHGQYRPLFHNVIVGGPFGPSVKRSNEDGSPRYRTTCGIEATGCYAPSFQHCYVWAAQTGYRVVSADRPEGPEDCAFYRSFAVGCQVGIDISTPIIEPQLVIDACHINCRDVGIRINKRKFFQIVNNLMYGSGDPSRPYTDIAISGSYGGVLTGNIFHSPAVDNLKPEPTVPRTMIAVDGKSRNLLIANNLFNAKGRALSVEDGATAIEFAGNQYMNQQTQPWAPTADKTEAEQRVGSPAGGAAATRAEPSSRGGEETGAERR